jgi:SAM-dependent methyltransferase
MTEKTFKDYFSTQSSDYQKYRPAYPDNLYKFLANISPSHNCAWDCATGNGQAATGLAKHFTRVIATDASRQQLSHAIQANNIEYQLAASEKTQIASNTIDLITVAQALHWFDMDAFYREAGRVLKDNGVIAVWTYNLLSISVDIDQIIAHLYADILRAYWPAERQLIESGYRDIPFPFRRITAPEFTMQAQWNLHELTGYFQSWSAVQNYMRANNKNPVQYILPMLGSAWGDAVNRKVISWPLHILVGQHSDSSN